MLRNRSSGGGAEGRDGGSLDDYMADSNGSSHSSSMEEETHKRCGSHSAAAVKYDMSAIIAGKLLPW